MNASLSRRPARSAASNAAATSSGWRESGFSQSTCFPASTRLDRPLAVQRVRAARCRPPRSPGRRAAPRTSRRRAGSPTPARTRPRAPGRGSRPRRAPPCSDACAPGMSFRLMSAVETIPHFTTSLAICVLSRNGGDRRRHARLRVHGQGPLERVPQDPVHDVAAAARAEARRHRRPERRGGRGGGASATATSTRPTTGATLVADERIGLFDNGGPNSLHAEPTIAAARGGQARRLREAARARRGRELRDLAARRRDRRQAPVRVQLPLRPGRPARAGDDRRRRARRDPPLPRPLPPGLGRRRLARHVALPPRRGRLRRARRPDDARRRPRALPQRRDRDGRGLREDVPAGPQGRRRGRGGGRVRERLRRHARGDALRARAAQRLPVGDQRHEGLARLRHGAAERAAGLPRRRRPRPRLQDGARLRDGPSVLGALVAAGTHHRLGRHVRARAAPHAAAIADDSDVAPYGATFEDGYRASEVCDAIVRSGDTGSRERISYR